jgi:exosome complex exonuclease RRP6
LPNPYQAEIEAYDNSIDNKDFDLTVVPEMYKAAEQTDFLYVDTPESLEELRAHLSE